MTGILQKNEKLKPYNICFFLLVDFFINANKYLNLDTNINYAITDNTLRILINTRCT